MISLIVFVAFLIAITRIKANLLIWTVAESNRLVDFYSTSFIECCSLTKEFN